jgi:uracil-DNA glycosylase family 4
MEEEDYAAGKLSFCPKCPLYKAPGPVFGEGPAAARIMVVGEAPGEEEARYRRPFIGGSGQVLTVLLAKAGISRKDVWVTNAVKCRPPGNRKPTGEEINCCSPILESEIADVKPNVVAAMGDTPLNALTYKTGIFMHRGVPLPGLGGSKVVGTLHPAYVMRDQSAFAYPIFDLQRVAGESAYPEIRRQPTFYVRDGTVEQAKEMYEQALVAGYIVYDIETTNLDPQTSEVICNGLGIYPGHSTCFRWHPEMRKVHSQIMLDARIEKVGQNSESFDQPFLEYKGVHFNGQMWDTMLMFHLVNSDMKKDLATVASFYTDMPYWKDEAKKGDLFLYNCKDVDATTRAFLEMKKELRSLDMIDLYTKHVAPVQPILRRMSAKGLKKDVDKAIMWSYVMRKKAAEIEAVLKEGFGDQTLNLDSPKQLMKVLYTDLGLPVQYTRDRVRGQRPTANEEALENLAQISDNPVFLQIIERRSLLKADSTFVSVATDDSGYIHPRFGTAKAATGRLNSWEPNAQNIPLELREIYIPDTPEHVFFSADWSQVEWRLAMVLSADKVGLDLLASGVDQHYGIAAETSGKRIENVTKDERYDSKFIVYGLSYGRGIPSIAKQLMKTPAYRGLTLQQATVRVTNFVNNFSKRFSTFWAWREKNVRFVERNGYLTNAWKRRRWWFSRQVTEVFNYPQQSNAADMMYDAIIAIDRDLPAGASLRLSVHDEVVGITPKDIAREVKECVDAHMNQAWPQIVAASANPDMIRMYYPQGWSCPAETVFGLNWKEAKEGNKALEKELLG